MKTLTGVSAAPGLVIGRALLFEDEYPEVPRYGITEDRIEGEVRRFAEAVKEAAAELETLKQNSKDMGREEEAIFNSHLMMAADPDFHYQIKARLESKYENIEWIVFEVGRDLSRKLMQSSDAYLRERAVDVADVSRRILNCLQGVKHFSLSDLKEDVILAVRTLLPSDVLAMNRDRVKAVVMDTGSRTSHTAILFRAFGIPSVLGLAGATREINSGDTLIVDGETGQVILNPQAETLKSYQLKLKRTHRAEEFSGLRDLPAETSDGRRVTLFANIGIPEEAESIAAYGAEGIGLYRSEFLFLRNGQASEEQQCHAYSRVVKAMEGKPVTIRTIDVGGDKVFPGMESLDEENPLLGWRAIRFSLSLPELFKTQLRAILRSSVHGPVRIMFPMISGIEELEAALALLEEAKAECRKKGEAFAEDIAAGTLVEIPSAVITADILAEKSAFFSIGTNDLIQYTMAADRGNEKVGHLARPAQPAVLRFIKLAADAAHAKGIRAAICGELASDPAAAALLVGMGLDEFSMTAAAIPQVKQVIRGCSYESCKALAEAALSAASRGAVEALAAGWYREHFPGMGFSDFTGGL